MYARLPWTSGQVYARLSYLALDHHAGTTNPGKGQRHTNPPGVEPGAVHLHSGAGLASLTPRSTHRPDLPIQGSHTMFLAFAMGALPVSQRPATRS